MTIEEIRKNAPKLATHYAVSKITSSIVYLRKDRRVINYCDGYITDEPLGLIKPL